MRDALNHWRKLRYYNPAEILRGLRPLEIEIADALNDVVQASDSAPPH
jgi:hypothetical protein